MTASPFARRALGSRTGVEVTELGLGTAPLGETFDVIEEDEARALLAAAWDGGVRYFDTSPWYGKGQAEHRLGRALYRRPRDEYVISSKVGRVLRRPSKPGPFQRDSDWIGGLEFAHDMDYSYDGVMRSFEDSLQRLGINRIDVLLIHDLDTWHFKSEAKVAPYWNQLATGGWRALEALRDQGVIKGIGAGFNTMGTIPSYLDFFDMDFFLIAMRYTLLEQDVLDAEFPRLRRARRRHRDRRHLQFRHPRHRRGPACALQLFAGGSGNPGPVAQMEAVCNRHGVPLAAAALQFPLGHPIVASVIPGAIARARGRAEHRRVPPPDPRRSLGRAEARKADPRRRAGSGGGT